MNKRLRGETWLRQLAVVALYGVSVSLFREMSISHWAILGGFYLSTLLLAPYRYWPALLLGEVVSLAHFSYIKGDQLGLAWAIANLVPSLLLVAPVVYWARERGGIFSHDRNVRISTLLLCSLVVAFLLTLNSVGLAMLTKLPPGYAPVDYGMWCARWILGNYLGILTMTPLALFAYQEISLSNWKELKHKFAQSRLILEIGCVLIPALAFLIWIGVHAAANHETRQIIQFAMFLPVVWLALRHGWHGAAVGGSCASIAIFALMPHQYDIDTIQAEILIAFVISTMLLMGARIAVLDNSRKSEREDLRMALALAQRNAQMGEMQLQMTSRTLEQIGLAVHSVCMTMTDRFRLPHSAMEDRSYQHLALTAKDQLFGLADSLYPAGWEEKGIACALREGQIPRTLDKAGIKYWCDVRCPMDQLSATLHLTIYRMACDAIAEYCAKRTVSEIGIKIRCGKRAGRRWVALRLSFRTEPAARKSVRWDQLLPQILPVGSGRGFRSIEDRAATFEGRARERALPRENRISVMMLDPDTSMGLALH
jgi:glucose-6-phosphate-specific signal transduction histidine kinase